MKHIYLAARYSRRQEMCGYRDELVRLGFNVTSRWLDEKHASMEDLRGVDGDQAKKRIARQDWMDLNAADTVITFTPGGRNGGCHTEFGAGLMAGKRSIVVGEKQQVFHYLPQVVHFPTWESAIGRIRDAFGVEVN